MLLVADHDRERLDTVRARLARVPGRDRAATLGRYPRFELLTASSGDQALQKAGPRVSALALALIMPRRSGLDVIQELRPRRPDLAILAFSAEAPPADAVAALLAGADHFHQHGDPRSPDFVGALEQAIDRRRLVQLIARCEAESVAARNTLAALGAGDLGLPGLRPPGSRDGVQRLDEAIRRYLETAARLFAGDPRGLAERLGMSYFALRRLLRRHEVPFPAKPRGKGTQ